MSKYKVYADAQTVDGKAIAQMESAMASDFAIRGALMPDVHAGYALPIGAVVETKNVVVPSWVGYDIGCGVSSEKLNITKDELSRESLEKIKELIFKAVPVGNNRHKDSEYEWLPAEDLSELGKRVFRNRASGQLGTLGGGNHFIELGYDKDEVVYITIHSGSRGLGHGLATEYIRLAAEAAGITRGNTEGNYPLHRGTPEYDDYINDVLKAQDYALDNRVLMSMAVKKCIGQVLGKVVRGHRHNVWVNQNHNHIERIKEDELDHFWIHRKGATKADFGELGVIPGNMRDGCFIVRGLGNDDYLCSSSHGAGRVLSRSQAKESISLEKMEADMRGIVGCVSEKTLDEAPDAYKNIFEVMEQQKDSVEVEVYLKPILNIKG